MCEKCQPLACTFLTSLKKSSSKEESIYAEETVTVSH